MIDEEMQKKLKAFDKKVQDARKDIDINQVDFEEMPEESPEAKSSARAGSEFLASVLGGGLFGFGIDWYFEMTPWAMIIFILIGFISGVYRANAAMKNDLE